MLYATPGSAPNDLQFLKIVLHMIANSDASPVPASLKSMFFDVVTDARELLRDPGHAAALRHPESVELALEMRSIDGLAASLEALTSHDALRPDLAGQLLSLIEAPSV